MIPPEDINSAPTGGIAGKLSDKEKFMNTIELLAGLEKPTEKNGYFLYAPLGSSEPQIAIGSDFFFAGFADKPKDKEPSIDKFMTADGSDSLLKNNQPFTSFSQESHDVSIWFGGDSILDTLSNQMDNPGLKPLREEAVHSLLILKKGKWLLKSKWKPRVTIWFMEREDFLMGF